MVYNFAMGYKCELLHGLAVWLYRFCDELICGSLLQSLALGGSSRGTGPYVRVRPIWYNSFLENLLQL